MTDILLGTDGDLDLTGNQLSLTPDRTSSVAQHLKIRLRFFQREWFLDTRLGIPYFERILVKRPNMSAVARIFREAVRETAGIKAISTFNIDFDPEVREAKVTFKAILEDSAEPLDFTDEIKIDSVL